MKKEFMITVNTDTNDILNSCLTDYSLEELALLKEEIKNLYFQKLVSTQFNKDIISVVSVK